MATKPDPSQPIGVVYGSRRIAPPLPFYKVCDEITAKATRYAQRAGELQEEANHQFAQAAHLRHIIELLTTGKLNIRWEPIAWTETLKAAGYDYERHHARTRSLLKRPRTALCVHEAGNVAIRRWTNGWDRGEGGAILYALFLD